MKPINSNNAPKAIGPYSQAISISNGFVFISGQLPINPQNNILVDSGIEAETRQVMDNIKAILQEIGLTFNNVIKASIFIKNLSDFEKINEIYGSYFQDNYFPARECIEVSKLPKNANIEVSIIAYNN